jgi:hypothetical protein
MAAAARLPARAVVAGRSAETRRTPRAYRRSVVARVGARRTAESFEWVWTLESNRLVLTWKLIGQNGQMMLYNRSMVLHQRKNASGTLVALIMAGYRSCVLFRCGCVRSQLPSFGPSSSGGSVRKGCFCGQWDQRDWTTTDQVFLYCGSVWILQARLELELVSSSNSSPN